VSDVPLGPGGFPNPFGFDIEQLMRMLQSQGPVNFEIALQVATTVATADAETGQPGTEPAIDPALRGSFDDVVRAAQTSVADTTGIATTLGIRSECVDRQEWARGTLNELTSVITALAGALQRTGAGDPEPDDLTPADPGDILAPELSTSVLVIGPLPERVPGLIDPPSASLTVMIRAPVSP